MATPIISPAAAVLDTPQAEPKNIGQAARQFEGLLLGQMLKSAHESSSEDTDEDSESQTMFDVADQQFAQVLANNGGIGLAQLVTKGLEKSNADRK